MSQTVTAAHEPLLRIAKREGTTLPQKILVRAIAILLALVVDALFGQGDVPFRLSVNGAMPGRSAPREP